jgi:hypothetical protein
MLLLDRRITHTSTAPVLPTNSHTNNQLSSIRITPNVSPFPPNNLHCTRLSQWVKSIVKHIIRISDLVSPVPHKLKLKPRLRLKRNLEEKGGRYPLHHLYSMVGVEAMKDLVYSVLKLSMHLRLIYRKLHQERRLPVSAPIYGERIRNIRVKTTVPVVSAWH